MSSLKLLFFHPSSHPVISLLALFVAWKTFLLIIALGSPGPGYDTSTSLLFASVHPSIRETSPSSSSYIPSRRIAEKLTRWDGIYFTTVARRGYLFEQEWAFGWAWTKLIALLASGPRYWWGINDPGLEALVGIAVAHLSHGASVAVLYCLTEAVFTASPLKPKRLAFITACLHIISPAGLFLSAPYTESMFSWLSFSGYYVYVRSSERASLTGDLSLVWAGLIFGLSVMIRSNGILNGILFLEEAVAALLCFNVRRVFAAGMGGALVGLGFLIPQTIAYRHFCTDSNERREWCTRMIPSIYTFVQAHYWNSGFFRYWTVPNIPLFLLAAPMFALLSRSAVWALTFRHPTARGNTSEKQLPTSRAPLRSIALVQAALGLLTLVNAHVQIVTRLASAYPVWYWWTASQIIKDGRRVDDDDDDDRKVVWRGVVRWMVMYAVIQGGLFASFLPPA